MDDEYDIRLTAGFGERVYHARYYRANTVQIIRVGMIGHIFAPRASIASSRSTPSAGASTASGEYSRLIAWFL
jgi:hypothetical protein